jgi:hypothetical protein
MHRSGDNLPDSESLVTPALDSQKKKMKGEINLSIMSKMQNTLIY